MRQSNEHAFWIDEHQRSVEADCIVQGLCIQGIQRMEKAFPEQENGSVLAVVQMEETSHIPKMKHAESDLCNMIQDFLIQYEGGIDRLQHFDECHKQF